MQFVSTVLALCKATDYKHIAARLGTGQAAEPSGRLPLLVNFRLLSGSERR